MGRSPIRLGGLPLVTLAAELEAGVTRARIAPGRGMMLLQAEGRLAASPPIELLEAPPEARWPEILDGGAADFAGAAAFSFGGAILLPYANRITGRYVSGRGLLADIDGRTVRLPRNWGGRAPGAAQYAMHGLILDLPIRDFDQPSQDTVVGRIRDWDFAGRWPGRADIDFAWRLRDGGLELAVDVLNVGDRDLPLGVGWHPYLRLPSGRRDQARIRVPARSRVVVNNYDEVLPTGEVADLAGGDRDVGAPGGLELGVLHLDDCFVDLARDTRGRVVIEVLDPAAHFAVRLWTDSPGVRAVQVYAPADRPLVVVEPQFNWPDPFGPLWPADADTGMAKVAPGGRANFVVRLQIGAAPLASPDAGRPG